MKLRCDYKGTCKNPAFAEVDWTNKTGDDVWSNLCFPHFFLEQYIHRKKMSWILSQVWYSHFWNSIWKVTYRLIP